MCRIAGYWDRRPGAARQTPEVIASMRDVMVYGGPDDAGSYLSRKWNLGLGHRRLSIIDLSEMGRQPMHDGTGNLWTVYNGEIYNFAEIRKELEARGRVFRSHTDTEVILHAYREWGMDCLQRFRGMFAFALWDEKEGRLILARDRAGVKPLYYSDRDGLFVFGSEMKSILRFPGFSTGGLDQEALCGFLQTGFITAPGSIFNGVRKLEPGHYLTVRPDGAAQIVRYWDVQDQFDPHPAKRDIEDAAAETEALMLEAFQYRMVSDVPVGVFLSGGLDSSLVTALLQSVSSKPLKTFTIGFDDPAYNEAPYAARVAKHLGTDHHELICKPENITEILGRFTEIYDEPFGDSSGIPTFLVSRLAREHVKVSLSADGGDEVFGGYTKYAAVERYMRRAAGLPSILRHLAAGFLRLMSPEAVERLYGSVSRVLALPRVSNLKDKFHKFRNLLAENRLEQAFAISSSFASRPEVGRFLRSSCGPGRVVMNSTGLDAVSYMQMTDFKTYLPDDILVKVDRATMQNSLEGREPFLDHKLVEFCAKLPSGLKSRPGEPKSLLRKILLKYVPRELVDRPKAGFGIPIYNWLRKDILPGETGLFAKERLERQGIFDPARVSGLVTSFMRGAPRNAHFVWFFYIFQKWYDRWMKA